MSDLPLSAQRAPSASEASPSAEIGRETESAPAESPLTRPLTRLIFWTASLGALIAAAVAIFAGAGAGWNGVILLSGIASVALLLMYALAAGETAGRSLIEPTERKRAAGGQAAHAMAVWPDPVLITDP
ncbi:MAG TPA: hybrid sensor histidine kinase/response regulator, partial [Oceanicaulis sp.]|nr:hybrid sensor histidine kinase/response regulator [Oceanicaulis sp.]